jgi:transcriptional regulator with XRE-family HTH domain
VTVKDGVQKFQNIPLHAGMTMYANPQKRDDPEVQVLRREGGLWLKSLREASGHTQRSFAAAVGADYYTFISQVENGRGRVPPERYLTWAKTLGMPPKEFLRGLMRYYDPMSYDILFGDEENEKAEEKSPLHPV